MKHRLIGISFGLLGAVLIAPALNAQGRGGTFFNPPARTGGTFFNAPSANGFMRAPGTRFPGRSGRSRIARHRHLYAYPYGYGGYWPYYPDYDYDDGAQEEAPFAPRSAAPAPAPETHQAADSVVMELRGDHWVRLTSTGPVEVIARPSAATVSGAAAPAAVLPAFDQAPAAAPLPAAVLVFRDGHQEEAARYTIIGNAIYLKADYYATGSWSRKIPIADLDVPATVKLNQQRGTKFTFPSRSSEVILRP